MADAVEESLELSRKRLLDNIISNSPSFYYNSMSNNTKERMVKEGLLKQLKELFDALNHEFKDVKFQYTFGCLLANNNEFHPMEFSLYNDEYMDDEDDFDGIYAQERFEERFFERPLNEIDIKIEFYWERVCSLGCKHLTKRFYVTNMTRLLDILTFWSLRPPVRTLVYQYIPDFFYDPRPIQELIRPAKPKKDAPKTRGRKPQGSSCKRAK